MIRNSNNEGMPETAKGLLGTVCNSISFCNPSDFIFHFSSPHIFVTQSFVLFKILESGAFGSCYEFD